MDDGSKKKEGVGNERSMRKYGICFGVACVIVLMFWAATFWVTRCMSMEERGTFGDQFGAVNALFTGLAFAGVVVTLWMQSIEIRQQFKEFRESTEANERHAEISRLTSLMNATVRELESTSNDVKRLLQFEYVPLRIIENWTENRHTSHIMQYLDQLRVVTLSRGATTINHSRNYLDLLEQPELSRYADIAVIKGTPEEPRYGKILHDSIRGLAISLDREYELKEQLKSLREKLEALSIVV